MPAVADNAHKLGHPRNSTISTLFTLHSKRQHGTSICSGEDASSRSTDLTFAYLILSMLSDDARKVIERQSEEYTWTDAAGLDKEMDGMAILALVL